MSVEERRQRRWRIWAVLPTYNEAENIAPLVEAILALDLDLHVVVVDDDSPDGTADIAGRHARQSPRVQVIRREGERGLGTAYLAGFRRAIDAGADAVLTMDCDFSHDPAAVPALVEALDSARLVIGSRYTAGGRIENWGLYRKLLSATANRFVRALFGLPVGDCTSGFRLYRAEVLENIPWQRVSSTGYSFLVESLYWAMLHDDGARVREVPICFVDRVRGQSKMGAREIFHGVINLLRLRVDLFKR